VTITPHTGLHDKQKVSVVGTGFVTGKQYGVTECADKGAATSGNDCNLGGIKVAVADSAGKVTISAYEVLKGPFGGNHIVCSSTQPCIVSVSNAGSAAPTEVASETIKFA
jgi:hypothetical protein